jgi:hypothetical protein
MAERVGNPVPSEIRDQLERGEDPLVYELATPPKDPGAPAGGTWAAQLAAALDPDDQHEVLLTKNRIVVVTTVRRTKNREIALSVPHDEIVAITHVGAGAERGRLRFDFRDGSATYAVMGLLFPRPAKRFLAAYESATPGRR